MTPHIRWHKLLKAARLTAKLHLLSGPRLPTMKEVVRQTAAIPVYLNRSSPS